MLTIENEALKVTVSEIGAELTSIIDKNRDRECLWIADPAIWGSHSPILFPVVGSCRNKEYRFEGKTYPMPQHGLARHLPFAECKESETKAVFTLNSDEETQKSYPFEWTLTITYELIEDELKVGYQVVNTAEEQTMYFSIGGHPGFMYDGELKDQQIEVNSDENLDRLLLNLQLAAFSREIAKDYVKNGEPIAIDEHIFDNDAIVFHNFKFTEISIKNKDTGHGVTMNLAGFPYVGIWSKPGAPYACIEPWFGLADYEDFHGELPEKDGIMDLAAGETFTAGYAIRFC